MAEPGATQTVSSARVAAYEACTHGERSDAIQQLAAALSAITFKPRSWVMPQRSM